MVSLHVPVKISCVTLCIIFPAFPCQWASQVLLSRYPSYFVNSFKLGGAFVFLWYSWPNFGDIVLKFCIIYPQLTPNKSPNLKTVAWKFKIFLI